MRSDDVYLTGPTEAGGQSDPCAPVERGDTASWRGTLGSCPTPAAEDEAAMCPDIPAKPLMLARRTLDGYEATEFALAGPSVLTAHAHDYASLSVLFLGSYSIEGGPTPVDVSAPMTAYFPPAVERVVSFRPGMNQFLWVRLPGSQTKDLPTAASEPRGFVPLETGRSQWIADRLVIEVRRRDRASEYLLRGMLSELLGLLLRSAGGPETGQPAWLAGAMELLGRQPETPPIHVVARRCGLHPSHFSRTFKKYVGCTPQEYTRHQRVATARLLLVHTNESLSYVAGDCGFSDQAHLTREFKRIVGCTPSQFRREIATRRCLASDATTDS